MSIRALSTIAALAAMVAATAMSGSACATESEFDYQTGLDPSAPDEIMSLPEAPIYTDYIPTRVDLSSRMPPVGDQEKIGSCVAWSTGYAARSYYVSVVEGRDTANPANIPSPAYIFEAISAQGKCEGGAQVPRALRLLMESGAPSLADVPYNDDQMIAAKCPRPTAELNDKKREFFIDASFRLDSRSIDQLKAELAQGNPVVFTMPVGKAFMGLGPDTIYQGDWKGYYSSEAMRGVAADNQLGGHALTLVGFDDDKQAFKLMNSWNTTWGDHGFAWIGYKAFLAGKDRSKTSLDRNIVDADAFTMRPRRIPPAPAPQSQ